MTTEELKNAAGFKAVDAEGNELGVVSLSDIVSAVKQELQPSGVARASVAALSEVSTQAATDTYEDQLPQKTDVTWIRGLDESGNPILISKQSLVSVAEGLMPEVTSQKKGLASSVMYKTSAKTAYTGGSDDDTYVIFANINSLFSGSVILVLGVQQRTPLYVGVIGIAQDNTEGFHVDKTDIVNKNRNPILYYNENELKVAVKVNRYEYISVLSMSSYIEVMCNVTNEINGYVSV